MRKRILAAAVLFPAALGFCLNLDLAAGLGIYIMPGRISGNMDDVSYYYEEMAVGVKNYEQEGYHYAQRLSGSIRPNAVLGLRISFPIMSRLSFGLEWDHAFSFREQLSNSAAADTLPQGAGWTIYGLPYAYALQTATVKSRNYIKSEMMGPFLEYTLPYRQKFDLLFGCGFGYAEYNHLYQAEYSDRRTNYYQANGNPVYSDSASAYFDAFVVRYTCFYIKPSAAIAWKFSGQLSARGGLALPLSYVETGFLGDEESNQYRLYPANRFTAGDLVLFAGVRMEFLKPKPEKK